MVNDLAQQDRERSDQDRERRDQAGERVGQCFSFTIFFFFFFFWGGGGLDIMKITNVRLVSRGLLEDEDFRCFVVQSERYLGGNSLIIVMCNTV